MNHMKATCAVIKGLVFYFTWKNSDKTPSPNPFPALAVNTDRTWAIYSPVGQLYSSIRSTLRLAIQNTKETTHAVCIAPIHNTMKVTESMLTLTLAVFDVFKHSVTFLHSSKQPQII